MKLSHVALLVVIVLGSAAGGIHLMHERGIVGAFEDWTSRPADSGGTAEAPDGNTPAPIDPADPAAPPLKPGEKRTNAKQVADGETCMERGDFDGAVENFNVARLTAGSDAEKATALKGLDRAVLLWALTQKPPKNAGSASELTGLVQKAESAMSEQAWFDAFRLAAACRANDRLPYLGSNLLDMVRHDGPTERWWITMAAEDTRRTDALKKALANRGVPLGGAAATPTATASGNDGEASGIGVKPPADGTSGIRGAGRRGIPYGNFTTEMREKLVKAVEWENGGRDEYALAAPDKQNRTEHAKNAVRLLQQAREVYVEALDQDPRASGLESRIAEVTRMISDTKKSLPAGVK